MNETAPGRGSISFMGVSACLMLTSAVPLARAAPSQTLSGTLAAAPQ